MRSASALAGMIAMPRSASAALSGEDAEVVENHTEPEVEDLVLAAQSVAAGASGRLTRQCSGSVWVADRSSVQGTVDSRGHRNTRHSKLRWTSDSLGVRELLHRNHDDSDLLRLARQRPRRTRNQIHSENTATIRPAIATNDGPHSTTRSST